MTSDRSVQAFGPQGHDPTVRKTIPIMREQISQSELAELLDVASRDSSYCYTSFAWRDGTTNLCTERLPGSNSDAGGSAAEKVRNFHQLEELNGVITQHIRGRFHTLASGRRFQRREVERQILI